MLDVALALAADWPPPAPDQDWGALAARAVAAALATTPHAALAQGGGAIEISVRLTDDAEMQALNAQWRGKDRPTNVLSFPSFPPEQIAGLISEGDAEILLGDVVLGLETCLREAADKGLALAAHASHLVVHGMLHLLGYDHGDDAVAQAMEDRERAAMAALGFDDPYGLDGQLLNQ